ARPARDRERDGAARGARGATGSGGAERAAARARETARRGTRARARGGARRVEAGPRAVRDLALLRAEPVAGGDARGGDQHDRGRARRRRRAHTHAGRAARVGAAARAEGGRPTTRGRRAFDPLPAPTVRRARDPTAVSA